MKKDHSIISHILKALASHDFQLELYQPMKPAEQTMRTWLCNGKPMDDGMKNRLEFMTLMTSHQNNLASIVKQLNSVIGGFVFARLRNPDFHSRASTRANIL